jgi:FkbM family methyltransferase
MKAKLSELTTKGIILRIIRRLSLLDSISQEAMFKLVTNQKWREKLNKFYNKLNADEKSCFHTIFHKTFKNEKINSLEGIWTTQFLNQELRMPLRKEKSWLDWENAISIVGHDIDVKQTYETLIKSKYRPTVFFDVGANYGTHSLLFLSQGIKAIAFEPNPVCKQEFEKFCELNNLAGQMESVAVGEKNGTVDFWFPEKATWLGTILESTKENLKEFELQKITVPLISLDNYTHEFSFFPDLIKIDTEGNEVSVIKGASRTIERTKPFIIFESNQLSNKEELWEIFQAINYTICKLPLLDIKHVIPFSFEKFIADDAFNYIALCNKHPILGSSIVT